MEFNNPSFEAAVNGNRFPVAAPQSWGSAESATNVKAQIDAAGTFKILRASEVTPVPIEWLWFPYLPKKYVTLFSGEEGVGKSWVFAAITAGITTGYLPLTDRFDPGNVLIFSGEDAAEDALVPRLIKCGADLSRVFIVNEKFALDEMGVLKVKAAIAETGACWVIMDPLFSYSDLNLDLNKPHHARAVTTSIDEIAKQFNISFSYLIHFNKSKGQGDARSAVSSSQEFSNAARSIVLIGKDPTDEDRRALVHRKHNYSPKGRSIGYQIRNDQDGAAFFWLGESSMTERDLVDRAGSSEEHAQNSEAVVWLKDTLDGGVSDAGEIKKLAKAADISEQQLRTARSKLGVKPENRGFGSDKRWIWRLPEAGAAVGKYAEQHLSTPSDHNVRQTDDLALVVSVQQNQQLSGSNQQATGPLVVAKRETQQLKVNSGKQTSYVTGPSLDVDVDICLPTREVVVTPIGSAQGREYGRCRCGTDVFIGKQCPGCQRLAVKAGAAA